MASQSQRRKREMLKAIKDESELFELDLEASNDTSVEDRVTKVTKSPLHLLLMITSPECPVVPGALLYVNVGKAHQEQSMELLEDARLRTSGGIRNSLSTAAHVYMPWRKGAPDGWELVKYMNPARPGAYVSMNTLFEECWRQLNVEIDVLEDDLLLYETLVERGFQQKAEVHYTPKERSTQKGKRSSYGSKG